MLAGSGDGDRDVEIRGDGFAGEPYLLVGRNPAGVHGGARGANRATEQVGQFFQLGEGFGSAKTAPAGHDYPGILQLDPYRLFLDNVDDAGFGIGRIDVHRERDHIPGPCGIGIEGFVGLGTQRGDLRRLGAADHRNGAATIDGAICQQATGAGIDGHFEAVLGETHSQAECQPGRQLASLVVAGDQDDPRVAFVGYGLHRSDVMIWMVFGQCGICHRQHLVGAVGDGLLGSVGNVGAQQCDGEFLAQAVGQGAAGGKQFLRGRSQLSLGGVPENQDSGSVCH